MHHSALLNVMIAAARKAFLDVLKDPEFLAEAEKLKLEITPVTGERVQGIVRELYATPRAVVEKAAEFVK